MSNQKDAVPITRIPLFFRLHRKKEASKSRDPAMLQYSCCPPKDSRPHRGRNLNSWQRQESCPSPNNWSSVFPERGSIFRRLLSSLANDVFRFRSYSSASLCPFIFCFILLRFLFLLFHYTHPVLCSVHKKDLFLRSATQPFVLLYSHVESLRSSVFYFKF